jgi:hypothetical protein
MSYKPQVLAVIEGGTGVKTLTNHGIVIGQGSSALTAVATGSAGQFLQSGGASVDPTWSTATFPATAGATGTILRADGTNWAATTATYPTTTTVSQILYSSATNVIGGITTANNSIVLTDGSGVPSLGTSLSNNFTFTTATAGTTRSATVSNTDNTNTASNALVQITSGGGSSGDPFITHTVTGATSFSHGIDNSASDAFKISQGTALGTNDTFIVQTTGEITMPLQSAFLASGALQSNVTGDSTVYTVQFTTEIFDQNNDFDGTSTFTAPVTARYNLGCEITANTLVAGNTQGIIQIITSNRNYNLNLNIGAIRNAANAIILNLNVLADMDAADTAIISFTVSGGTKTINVTATSTYFFGNINC